MAETKVRMTIPRYPAVPEGTKIVELPRATPEEQVERMAFFRKVVAEKQYQPMRWYDRSGKKRSTSLDLFTASMMCKVYDSVSDENKGLLCAMEPLQMVDFGWKLTRK